MLKARQRCRGSRGAGQKMQNDPVYIIGAGGHAKVVIAALLANSVACAGVFDDDSSLWGKKILDIPILGAVEELRDSSSITAVNAIGNNSTRRAISERFRNINWLTLIHPHTWVHNSVKIGYGTVVFAGAVIQPDTKIGKHSIINTSASVDHDCVIGDFCHIAPGCHIAGGVQIGDEVFLGIGTAIIPCVSIVSNTVIGAGSTVIDNIDDVGVYVGTPARRIKV